MTEAGNNEELKEKAKIKDEYIKELWSDYRYSISKFDEQTLIIGGGALGFLYLLLKILCLWKTLFTYGCFIWQFPFL